MPRSDPLEFAARRRLYEFIEANPGFHMRELQRLLGVPMSTLAYHLRALEKKGLVIVKEDKYYRRFYPDRGVPPDDKTIVSALRNGRMRDIILYLLMNGGGSYRELLDALRLPPSSLSLYLRQLVDRGVVKRKDEGGGGSHYFIHEEEALVRLLETYRRSFLDKTVDAILEVWLDQTYRSGRNRGAG